MVRVEVKNFQSMVDEVIEIDGFSAMVGRSNIGKSAVVRAIKAALTGAPSDSYVRHDGACPKTQKGAKSCKCFCSVRIIGPGLDLLWEKGDAVNHYIYNGVEHTAVNRGTPEFLGPGFGSIELGNDKVLLQVSDQFRPLFILDKSGTVVADVLSDVAKLDQINVAIRMVEKDRKEASNTRKVRDRDIGEIRTALSKYSSLDSALSNARDVVSLGTKIEREDIRLRELSHYFDSLTLIARALKQLSVVTAVSIPDALPTVSQGATWIRLSALGKRLQDKVTGMKSLSEATSIEVPVVDSFGALAVAFKSLVKWSGRVRHIKISVEGLRKADGIVAPEVGALSEAKDSFKKLVIWSERLSSVTKTISALSQSLEAHEIEEKEVLESFSALGVCPTCKQDVQAQGYKHHQETVAHA